MAEGVKAFYERFNRDMVELKQEMPDTLKGFGSLFAQTMKEGALSVKEKELIALGIGLALRCEPCINMHVKKSLDAGATREEVLDAAGVGVMMQGGPSYTYLPTVVEALDACEQKNGG